MNSGRAEQRQRLTSQGLKATPSLPSHVSSSSLPQDSLALLFHLVPRLVSARRSRAARGESSAEGLAHGVAAVAHGAHQEALDSRAFRAEEEERDLHPVRGRQVVPMRGRADPLVHPRRVPPAAVAAAEAVIGRPAGRSPAAVRRSSTALRRTDGLPAAAYRPRHASTDCRWHGVVYIKMIERAAVPSRHDSRKVGVPSASPL